MDTVQQVQQFESQFTALVEFLKKNLEGPVSDKMITTLKAGLISSKFDQFGGNLIIKKKKRINGYNLFMKERMQSLKESGSDADSNHRMTIISKEWKAMTEEERTSWKTKAQAQVAEPVKVVTRERKPRKPSKLSGYQLFVKEQMPTLKDQFDRKERMAEIGRRWRALDAAKHEEYKQKALQVSP